MNPSKYETNTTQVKCTQSIRIQKLLCSSTDNNQYHLNLKKCSILKYSIPKQYVYSLSFLHRIQIMSILSAQISLHSFRTDGADRWFRYIVKYAEYSCRDMNDRRLCFRANSSCNFTSHIALFRQCGVK